MIKLKEYKEGNWTIGVWQGKTHKVAAATLGHFTGNPIETVFSSPFSVYVQRGNTMDEAIEKIKREISEVEKTNSN